MTSGVELAWTLRQVGDQDDGAIEGVPGYDRQRIYGKAWISPQFARYPQHLTIQLDELTYVKQLLLLAHHQLIPKSVTISIAAPLDDRQTNVKAKDCDFFEMGKAPFVGPSPDGKPRHESKMIYINHKALFIKLSFKGHHSHEENPNDQVALVFGYTKSAMTVAVDHNLLESDEEHLKDEFADSDDDGSDTNFHAKAIVRRDRLRRKKGENKKEKKKKRSKKKKSSRSRDESESKGNNLSTSNPFTEYLTVDGRRIRHPTYVDLEEFDQLVSLLDSRKEEAVYERRYLDAKEMQAINYDLGKKRAVSQGMIDRLIVLIQEERYTEAQILQDKYDEQRFTSTQGYDHIDKFLTEKEHKRFVDDFGRGEVSKRTGGAASKVGEDTTSRVTEDMVVDNVEGGDEALSDIQSRYYRYDPMQDGSSIGGTNQGGDGGDDVWGEAVTIYNHSSSSNMDDPNDTRSIARGTYPDEARVQKVIAMDAARDTETDQELTDIMVEMEDDDRHDLDWRVQVIMRRYGKLTGEEGERMRAQSRAGGRGDNDDRRATEREKSGERTASAKENWQKGSGKAAKAHKGDKRKNDHHDKKRHSKDKKKDDDEDQKSSSCTIL